MFKPSSAKVDAAIAYLNAIERKPKSFATARHEQGKERWRRVPAHLRSRAEQHYQKLLRKYFLEHGCTPSRWKAASLMGNVTQNLIYGRHHRLSAMWRYWNARRVARGSEWTPSKPFTKRVRSRASIGNLIGI
jgi:hypothetical protein